MGKILDRLEKEGLDLSKMRALEVFAREGDWQTRVYADKVKSLEAWEIDPAFEKNLKKNIPHAKIKITNSMVEIKKKDNFSKYDFIVIDNGQSCYGPNQEYCEHFEVVPQIARLLDKEGILIFNVNREPFGYDKLPLWKARREEFYNSTKTDNMSIEWLLDFYQNLFKKYGYDTKFSFNMERGTPERNNYLHYLVFYLKVKNQ